MFNPWRHLGEQLPHVDIIWTRLPGDLRGLAGSSGWIRG